MKTVKESGLPIPIFFRGDDVEWSWRHHGKHHISMNGICIWHASFAWRVTKVTDIYYLHRNMFMINSLYTESFRLKFENFFTEKFGYLLKTYDYVSLDLLLRAMDDILKGSKIFRENPEEQFKEINQLAKVNYIDCTNDWEFDYAKNRKLELTNIRRFLYRHTHFGKYFPKFLMKKSEVAPESYPPVRNFLLTQQVKAYNPNIRKYEVRNFDRNLMIKYEKEFYRRLKLMKKNYPRLVRDYKDAIKEFATVEFWEDYLGLKEKND